MRTCIVYPGMDRAGTLRRATPRCFGCARRVCRDARFCGAKAFPLPERGKGHPAGMSGGQSFLSARLVRRVCSHQLRGVGYSNCPYGQRSLRATNLKSQTTERRLLKAALAAVGYSSRPWPVKAPVGGLFKPRLRGGRMAGAQDVVLRGRENTRQLSDCTKIKGKFCASSILTTGGGGMV